MGLYTLIFFLILHRLGFPSCTNTQLQPTHSFLLLLLITFAIFTLWVGRTIFYIFSTALIFSEKDNTGRRFCSFRYIYTMTGSLEL